MINNAMYIFFAILECFGCSAFLLLTSPHFLLSFPVLSLNFRLAHSFLDQLGNFNRCTF
ncbi:hypothetical protein GALL_167430 [mine drainage metagenome]|uniref:Uncharacterized protein n=1 Tax=mine drainage metagenome TaxID=410659 RepID=A0A1J5RZC3_9ZZZZ